MFLVGINKIKSVKSTVLAGGVMNVLERENRGELFLWQEENYQATANKPIPVPTPVARISPHQDSLAHYSHLPTVPFGI